MNEEIIETNPEMNAGEMLRAARTTGRRKREIATVAKQLCIREEFLQALEDGNYTFIPETVYVLGFARNYAMELGLDPDVVVAKIKREMGLVSEDGTDTVVDSRDDKRNSYAMGAKKAATGARTCAVASYYFVRRKWKWFLGAIAVILILVVGVIAVLPHDVADNADANTTAPVTANATVTDPAFKVSVRERFGTENRDAANVVIQATAESWVKIEDGRGNTVFSRVLVPGDVYYVPAGDKYKGTFGNAGAIDIWVDGKAAPKVGADHARANAISMAPSNLLKKSE